MAEKVGRKTGKKTQAGRDVYETPEKGGTPHGSEMVSEKSTTFEYKGKWINIPSIHDGYKYEDDILRLMLDAEIIEPTSIHDSKSEALKAAADRSDKLKFSKGGATMNKQMNLAFMQEGGMKDDGMDKDPVSGNDIPAGSMAKEVRDDIPAQLSDGEYVVPADVMAMIGNGNPDDGADEMDEFISKFRKVRKVRKRSTVPTERWKKTATIWDMNFDTDKHKKRRK